jgi:DNA-binding response OmpR family regulator
MAKGKILMVDDERKILSLVRSYLEREDYRVIEATDGCQAIVAFRGGAPDLIVLDIMLSEVDGLEVRRISRRTSEVLIIMLTARDEDF